MSLFVMLMMVRINYYIATVWPKARYLLGDEGGEKVNHLFDVALPCISPSRFILTRSGRNCLDAYCGNAA
jgi:hypothetical protein